MIRRARAAAAALVVALATSACPPAVAPVFAGELPASCRLEGAPTPRPEWCRPGWACRPTAEDNALGICLADLKAAIASCSTTSKYGWCAGGGFSFGMTPTVIETDGEPADLQMRWQPSLGFSLTWGRRLP